MATILNMIEVRKTEVFAKWLDALKDIKTALRLAENL